MRARQPLSAAWAGLPEALRGHLVLASTGWRHLARAGALGLGLARQAEDPAESARLAALAADMLLWAFGENPLSGPLAAEILSAPQLPLPEAARAALTAVAANWRVPEVRDGGLAYFERLAQTRDSAKLAAFLAGQVDKDPAALFWREKALALALYAAEPDQRAALEATALGGLDGAPGLGPVAAALTAQAAFLRRDTGACLAGLTNLDGAFGPGFARARQGLALLAAGEAAAALPLLLHALDDAPWQAGLALVAADVLDGSRAELVPPPGPALVLLYTWNKAADLDATLASLFASDLSTAGDDARVVALDNGSTDDTPRVLDAWADRAGARLKRVTLPVNIGAPAARNWLAALPEARTAETLVYLDDDVDLPPDWLARLGAALARHPDAGVVGCKVADHHAPHLLQNVAGHLVIPPEPVADTADGRPDVDYQSVTPNPFRLLDAHLQGPDWGLFDYMGPCASVTGCCHLFRRERLDAPPAAGGGFSLALGPSQYDDFERDLRMLDSGANAVYTGHLRVRHRKRSGLSAQGTGQGVDAAGANAAGNRYKMQCMHDRASIAAHMAAQADRLLERQRLRFGLVDEHSERAHART